MLVLYLHGKSTVVTKLISTSGTAHPPACIITCVGDEKQIINLE